MCVQTVGKKDSGKVTPRKNEQRLLRNMGVHNVVLEFLQVSVCFNLICGHKPDLVMFLLKPLLHEFMSDF